MWGRGWGRDRTVIAAQAPKPRVVQHRGRRYSIRLETIFWKFLEYLAGRQGIRLGRYIAGLAESYSGNNLSSYLRVVCMLEAERSVAEAFLQPTRDSLLTLVRDCPSPGIVVSRDRAVLGYNAAFADWLGPDLRVLAGSALTDILQLRTNPSFNEVWNDMLASTRGSVKAHALRVSPGRVNVAQATIVPLRLVGEDGFYAVIWLEAKRAANVAEPKKSTAERAVLPAAALET